MGLRALPRERARWRELGYRREPDPTTARQEHDALRDRLRERGVEVVELPGGDGLSMDAVYVHDPSLVTDHGAITLRMGKEARGAEPGRHAEVFRRDGIPLLGSLGPPATAEGGDLLWIDERTLLAGRGYRTNAAGIAGLRELLGPHGVEVVEAPLPYGAGPEECLHLMSLISMLDERTAVVDLAWLAVSTVELLRERGVRFVEMDPSERETLGCNVLSLGERRLVALADNRRTNGRLREAGFDVIEIRGSQIAQNGRGGPTCWTRALLRRRGTRIRGGS